MEFSKRITKISWAVALILTFFSVIFPVLGWPVEGVVAALPYSWGELTAANGFYLWKAKNENRSKYAMKFVDKYARQYDVETGLRVAEIVLKD